ncbi:MAG: hypothetical protein EXQ55_03740 [Acidobacteria bacterium]|nr:hypothetical protein [Acidobacteriota bacterium]
MSTLIDFLLHSDKHLLDFIAAYGTWVYAILFAIVFAETGLVVTPFLPGDSLLFAAGALSAAGVLNPWLTFALIAAAAFTGNSVNYAVGRAVGPRVIGTIGTDDGAGRDPSAPEPLLHRLINPQYVQRAHVFFEQYGGKAVILARFVPIVRTFMPFVAGAAQMRASAFFFYNFVGAFGWVLLCLGAGILFGNVPIVKEHFSLVTIGIVVVSILPMLFHYLQHRRK